MSWSQKYKKSIDCKNPKGFSQKAHCAGRKKKMAKGGSVSSASKRADGCATKGKTKGRII